MRVAFVVHRYGKDVGGGSEAHCRDFAMRLAARHKVTVLTSCAREYVTWANSFSKGPQEEDGIPILRFPVSTERNPWRFQDASNLAFTGRASREQEEQWFRENGPHMPALLDYLKTHADDFDRYVFFSFRYYQSYFGLPLVADRSILVPTAEEDPAIRLNVLESYFRLPRAICYNTVEEQSMIAERCGGVAPPGEVVGAAIERPRAAPAMELLEPLGVRPPYLLYLGRVDPNKGCDQMLRSYRHYASRTFDPLPLVLAGKAVMDVPNDPLIRQVGYVTDQQREALLAHTTLLVMPSPFESLCMVVLEAWNRRRPVLVNGHCRVLKGQVTRANGGVYYENSAEFAEGIRYLTDKPEVADRLGAQGYDFVETNYRPELIVEKLERLLR